MPVRETQGTNNGWIARICDRLALKRGKRSRWQCSSRKG
jgi:hypothetical protein